MEEILIARKRIFGEKHPYIIQSYRFLGKKYNGLSRYEEGLKMDLQALELKKELFGKRHPEVANCYGSVGVSLGNLGRHEEALKKEFKALKLTKELLGERHPDVAGFYNNVGCTLANLGRHEEALKMKLQALELIKELLGERHPNTANFYDNVGQTLSALGRYKDALKKQLHGLELAKDLHGEKDHEDIAIFYNSVGKTLGCLGRHEEALKMKLQSLELKKNLHGEKYLAVANSYGSVGNTLGCLGRHEEALKMKLQGLELEKELLGEKHPDVAHSCNNVGKTYLKLKDPYSSLQYFREALFIYQNNPSFNIHTDTVNAHYGLRKNYGILGDMQKSREHEKEAKRIEEILKNRELWEESVPKVHLFVSNRQYKKAFDLIHSLPAQLKEKAEVLCLYLQLAILCPNVKVKNLQGGIIKQAEDLCKKEEPKLLVKLQLTLTTFWIHCQRWDKAFACVRYLGQLGSCTTVTYELLDVAVMKEHEQVTGEIVALEILSKYLTLQVFQGQKKTPILIQTIAKQLTEKLDLLGYKGFKVKEIETFCNEILQGL